MSSNQYEETLRPNGQTQNGIKSNDQGKDSLSLPNPSRKAPLPPPRKTASTISASTLRENSNNDYSKNNHRVSVNFGRALPAPPSRQINKSDTSLTRSEEGTTSTQTGEKPASNIQEKKAPPKVPPKTYPSSSASLIISNSQPIVSGNSSLDSPSQKNINNSSSQPPAPHPSHVPSHVHAPTPYPSQTTPKRPPVPPSKINLEEKQALRNQYLSTPVQKPQKVESFKQSPKPNEPIIKYGSLESTSPSSPSSQLQPTPNRKAEQRKSVKDLLSNFNKMASNSPPNNPRKTSSASPPPPIKTAVPPRTPKTTITPPDHSIPSIPIPPRRNAVSPEPTRPQGSISPKRNSAELPSPRKAPPPPPPKPSNLEVPTRERSNGVSAANPVYSVNPEKELPHKRERSKPPTLPRTKSADNLQSEAESESRKSKEKEREKEVKKSAEKDKTGKKKSLLQSMKLPFQSKKNITVDRVAQHLKDLENQPFSLLNTIADAIDDLDTWTTKKHKPKDWNLVQPDFATVDEEYLKLLDMKKAKAEGFMFEFGRNDIPFQDAYDVILEQTENDIPYYKDYFLPDHVNYLASGEDDQIIGPVSLSIEPPGTDERKVIIRTKKGIERFYIPAGFCDSSKEMLKYVLKVHPELEKVKFVKIPLPELTTKLVEIESQTIIKKYKFGLLYVKEGQTNENEMFSNVEHGPEYEEFLNFLGERITLQGWKDFRGGLDAKNNTTGTHSVFTQHMGIEIMFHVSTLLPFQPDDLQRVERKRHLGNDIVQIMFKEGNTPFDPLCLTTHFNNIFVVIQRDYSNPNKTQYKIAIANKIGVPPYGPFLKYPPIYEQDDNFRNFLLTKLINSERAAMLSPDFKGKMIRTNKQLLEDMATDFIAKSKTYKATKTRPSTPPPVRKNSSLMESQSTPSSPVVRSPLLPNSSSSPSTSFINNIEEGENSDDHNSLLVLEEKQL